MTVGRVGRPHGLDGSFVVERASEDARALRARRPRLRRPRAGDGRRVEARRRAAARRSGSTAGRSAGALLELPRRSSPAGAEDELYAFQLVGLAVEEEGGRELGRVAE